MIKNSSTKDLKLTSNERLFLDASSIFKPKKYGNIKPNGFKIYTFNAGFKKKYDDLLVIIFDDIVSSINIYSKTSTPSAPIIWDKKNNEGKVRALIVNSGNANAHTGKEGLKLIDSYVNFLSKLINCDKKHILVSSTGVIGELFDPKAIINQLNKINNSKVSNLLDAAIAIMTTDTYPKISIDKVTIDNKRIKIYGIAKGSGMIQPNMGTMLAYIFIEANVSKILLKKLIKENIENTFNSISVDSDTSTSDTLILFSLKKIDVNLTTNNFKKLNNSLNKVMRDLSLQVIKDGEGVTKLIKANVFKCKSKKQAKNIAFSIVNSPLVKTAVAGEDANWGRIIMAIGKSGERIDQNKIKISFGKYIVCQNGSISKNFDTININKYMKRDIIEINVYLNIGYQNHTVYGNDLNYEYIRINADYRS